MKVYFRSIAWVSTLSPYNMYICIWLLRWYCNISYECNIMRQETCSLMSNLLNRIQHAYIQKNKKDVAFQIIATSLLILFITNKTFNWNWFLWIYKTIFPSVKDNISELLLKVRNVQQTDILQILVQFFSRGWQNGKNTLIGFIRVWLTLMFCNIHNKQRLGLMVIWFCLKFNVNFYSRVQNAIQRPTLCLFPLCKK